MDSLYNYYLPNKDLIKEIEFSSSEMIVCGNRVFKKDDRFQQFMEVFKSFFWFSYRKDFIPISPSYYTTDVGWGCMLRSGQMILAHVLMRHFIGTDWKSVSTDQMSFVTNKILKLFEDSPNAPFSIHKIATIGNRFGKNIGEWFAPSTISQVIGELMKTYELGLSIYISTDTVLYLDEIQRICFPSNALSWRPLFILVPLRLGLDNFNDIYHSHLKATYRFPQSVGIIGGKPRAAMYFVSYQENYIYYLDPHVVQPYLPIPNETKDFNSESFHCSTPQRMLISSLDPSLAIGFYCHDKRDFDDFWRRAVVLSSLDNPIFSVQNEAPDYRQENKSLSLEEFEDDIVIL